LTSRLGGRSGSDPLRPVPFRGSIFLPRKGHYPEAKEESGMRRSHGVGWIGVLLAVLAWGCAGTPGPGDPGYPFNLSGVYAGEIYVEGMAFSFEMDVRMYPGGELGGTYTVTSPMSMGGDVAGTLVADTARFNLDYMNPMDGCGGTLDGTGTVEAGGETFAGRVRVNDSCGGYLSGTFSTRKSAK